jgi:endonuclease/exonuclease/phosphatase family metal-dependent hydrolase
MVSLALSGEASMDIRVGTFNVENLFNRYSFLNQPWNNERYERFVMAVDVVSIASRAGDLVAEPTTVIQRNNTALAIEELDLDILAVQEVENIYSLRNFNNSYLNDYFDHIICIDGNDPRAIDVGLMIRKDKGLSVLGIRTHIDDPEASAQRVFRESRPNFGYFVSNAVFSRDCLEVDVEANGTVITLMVNHFKAQDGKPSSIARRRLQAERVASIAMEAMAAGRKPIVLGDLNIDTRQSDYDRSLDPLFDGMLEDSLATLPEDNRWTHFYSYKKKVSRLDYILTDPSLNARDPLIFRKGLSTKCKQYGGERFATIGPEHTEASDHCPTAVTVTV